MEKKEYIDHLNKIISWHETNDIKNLEKINEMIKVF